MNILPDDLQKLHGQLFAHRDALIERRRRLEADLGRQFEPLVQDSADRAIQLENDETLHAIRAATDADIAQINLALERVAVGSYGICTRCKGPIDLSRLSALPWASTCVRCADS